MSRSSVISAVFIFAAAALALCCAIAQTTPPPPAATKQELDALPAGPGKELVKKFCVSCHNVKIVTGKHGTEEEWGKTIDKMISAHGVPLSDADADTIVDYLSSNYGPSSPKPAGDPTGTADKPQ